MRTTVIITASVTHGTQSLAPGVQLDVIDAVALAWVNAGLAYYAGSPVIEPEIDIGLDPVQSSPTPAKTRSKKQG